MRGADQFLKILAKASARRCYTLVLWALCTGAPDTLQAKPCEFPIVKAAIDDVLDVDQAKGETFRKEFKLGSDSLAVMDELVRENFREKLRNCHFEAGEYLTKRGFAPLE